MLRQFLKLASINTNNRNLLYGIKNLNTSPLHLLEENVEAMEMKQSYKTKELLGKYDKEQEEKILKIINNYNLDELLCFEISKSRANKLLTWRTRYGLLKGLKEILFVEGFGIQIADKFFKSILVEPKTKELKIGKGRTAPFVTPSLEAEQRQAIKSSVSVRIGINSITWSRLDIPGLDISAPCLLTDWQHHEISEKKLHINELIQRCLYIQHLIPPADCYIFENPQMAQASNNPGSVEQQNINIQKTQVIAIMGYALASRNSQFNDVIKEESDKKSKHLPNIFYVRRLLSARLFDNLVGTERVSSEQTILNMMRTFYNTNHVHDFLPTQQDQQDLRSGDIQQLPDNNVDFSGCVQFPTQLREMFSKSLGYHREFLSQALLLNLAFIRLVLLQTPESIAIVSRRTKAKMT